MTTMTMPTDRPTRRPWYRSLARVLGRSLLILLVLLVALTLAGLSYEAVMAATDAGRYPPPGEMVDVGGHRLHLHCVGSGSPTVVFESGKGGTVLDWSLVQPQLATETRVCTYDRAGLGWSEAGPLPRTPERVVEDLHTLLGTAGERGPYVLAAHSLGGRYVRLFAERYPDQVAGMVLVDARSEYHDQHIAPALKAELAARNTPGPEIEPMRRLGLLRLFAAPISTAGNPEAALLPKDTLTTMMVQSVRPGTVAAAQSEFTELEQSDAILQTATLGNLPLRVLVSEQASAVDPLWMEGQEDQAARSTNSTLRFLPGSHFLQYGNAEAVIAAVREVVQVAAR
jgi:pimeloyl-ACP methyl ester carboxylesterase